ncbi:MAG: glucosaminidase domain-containing protein [Chloroflexia bacterium]
MSGAVALARAAQQLEVERRRTISNSYRLLGDQEYVQAPRPAPKQPRPRPNYTPQSRQAMLLAELPNEPYYRAARLLSNQNRPRVAHPQWLVGTAVCLVALIAVGPVMASGRASSGVKRVALSGFTGAQATPEVAAKEAPAIDVTTAPEATAPAPPPAAKAGTATKGRQYELLGPPTVSVNAIEAVLWQYGSEAAGRGQAIYDLGVRYGIDPAYALAFFVHESACGTRGVARFTHSIGNIRWTSGYDNYEGYRSYPSWEQGIEDWYKLITDLYINGWGLRTVDAIVPVYAPTGDNNNPPGYVAAVKQMVDTWRGK